ncbi:hypothetical protein [Streptomyces sp. NPDC060031]|uniref:hypothetical protein n=1 Tax=Streptomyces sp. NPDC060031 TaxID=3347043 RepID=UPI0036C1E15A
MPEPVDQPPRTATAGPLTCPRCGREDRVTGVGAAYLAAKAKLREETGTGEDSKVTTREENSALAQALAPAPPEPAGTARSCAATLLLLGSVGTFIWGAVAGKWLSRDSAERWIPGPNGDGHVVVDPPLLHLAWISGAALALAVLLFVVEARITAKWRRRTLPGRGAADAVWSAGWYCDRCGTVHFTGEPALTLQQFRTRVWSAGDYGDLAREHPAL